jgi:hypothetical protein
LYIADTVSFRSWNSDVAEVGIQTLEIWNSDFGEFGIQLLHNLEFRH